MTKLEKAAVAVMENRQLDKGIRAELWRAWCRRFVDEGPFRSCFEQRQLSREIDEEPVELCEGCRAAVLPLAELRRVRRRRGGLYANMYRLARLARKEEAAV